MWVRGTGVIVYDPPRSLKRGTAWWCVINVSESIGLYYRWWVKRALGIDVHRPPHPAHISVIRGEQPPEALKHLWRKYDGKWVDFRYSVRVRQSGDTTGDRPPNFWFLDVDCPMITTIREEFGFVSSPKFPHLTIGRTYDSSRLAA